MGKGQGRWEGLGNLDMGRGLGNVGKGLRKPGKDLRKGKEKPGHAAGKGWMCVVWQPLRAPGMASEQGRDHGAVVHGKAELCQDKREIGESWNEHPSKNTPILWEEAQTPHSW